MATTCTHLDQIRDVEPRTPEGCEECLRLGDRWVHLRLCLTCGHVGCCDSSKNKHATKHFHMTGHPIVRSFEPNEDWTWCYVDQVVLEPADVDAAIDRSRRAATTSVEAGDDRAAGALGGLMSRLVGSPFRSNYVVGVVDDPNGAKQLAEVLWSAGFAHEEVALRPGREIEERMRNDDIGNLVREATTEEGAISRDFAEESRGGSIVSVHASTPEEVERAGRIMMEHGAHSLKHFGDRTISDLEAGGMQSG